MALTPAGRLLESKGRPLLVQMDTLIGEIAVEGSQISGTVRLAIPPSLGVIIPADIVQAVQAQHPLINVQVIVALSGAVADGLSRGDLDLGVLYASVSRAQISTAVLYRESLWLVGPKKAKLRSSDPLTLAHVLAHPMILPTRRHGLRIVVEDQAAQRGLMVDVRAEIDGMRLLLELVARGAGFSLLPEGAVERELKAGRLTAAPVERPKLYRTALLGRPQHRPSTAATSVLKKVLEDRLKDRVRER